MNQLDSHLVSCGGSVEDAAPAGLGLSRHTEEAGASWQARGWMGRAQGHSEAFPLQLQNSIAD